MGRVGQGGQRLWDINQVEAMLWNSVMDFFGNARADKLTTAALVALLHAAKFKPQPSLMDVFEWKGLEPRKVLKRELAQSEKAAN